MISIAAGASWEGEVPVPADDTPAGDALNSPGQPVNGSPAGAVIDAEGEEAFLEQTTGQQGMQSKSTADKGQIAVLRVRPRGAQEWAATCALLDGSRCSAGVQPLALIMQRRGMWRLMQRILATHGSL